MHWHAFTWKGPGVPSGSAAAALDQAVMPMELRSWFSKPNSLFERYLDSGNETFEWMRGELVALNIEPDQLAYMLRHYREQADLRQDVYAGLYVRGGLQVRAALTCPRSGADTRRVQCSR